MRPVLMQRNYAKTFTGFKCRILARIAGFTVLNKYFTTNPSAELNMLWLITPPTGYINSIQLVIKVSGCKNKIHHSLLTIHLLNV
jgi:hypothetical protein